MNLNRHSSWRSSRLSCGTFSFFPFTTRRHWKVNLNLIRIHVYSPTTSKYPTCDFIGSVLIWKIHCERELIACIANTAPRRTLTWHMYLRHVEMLVWSLVNGVHASLPSPIRFTDVFQSQLPYSSLCVSDCDAMVLGDNIRLNRENRLSVYAQPRNLERQKAKRN